MTDLTVAPHSADLRRIVRRYGVLAWSEEEWNHVASSEFAVVALADGALVLDGAEVARPRFAGNVVSWSQKTPEHFTAGVLMFRRDRLAFHGWIYSGATEVDAKALVVFGAVPPSHYTSQLATVGTPDGTTPPDPIWVPGPRVTLGFKPATDGHDAEPFFEYDGKQAPAAFTNDEHGNLVATVNADRDRDLVAFGLPGYARATFAWDGRSFNGYLQTDADETAPRRAWLGTTTAALTAEMRPIAQRTAQRVNDDPDLSVADLLSIAPDHLQREMIRTLVENMKWAIDQNTDWLRTFFLETRPDLSTERIATLQLDMPFYTDRFAPAYLGWAFTNITGPNAPRNPLSDGEKRRLKYFLHHGLSKDSGFNKQSTANFLHAFKAVSPRLQRYLDDGGPSWAARAFDALTTPAQINLIIEAARSSRSAELSNRMATILSALEREGTYARKFNEMIVAAMLPSFSREVNLDDEARVAEWLERMITIFVAKYKDPPPNPTEVDLSRKDMASDLTIAMKVLGSAGMLAKEMAKFIAAAKTAKEVGLFGRIDAASESFGHANPTIARAARFMRVAALGGGLYSAITGFQNWQNLSATDKARLITNVVELMGKMIESIPDIIAGGTTTLEMITGVRKFYCQAEEIEMVTIPMRNIPSPEVGERWLARGAENMNEFFREGQVIETEETFFGRMFGRLKGILGWLGPVVAAAYAVLSTIDFVRSLHDDDQKQQAYAGIVACAAILETVVLVAALASEMAIFPPAAAVLAIIGLVFTIVMLIDRPSPPPTPMEKFLDDTVRPFVRGLEEPPPDWEPRISPATMIHFAAG